VRPSPKNFKDKKKVGFYFSKTTIERMAWIYLKRTRERKTTVFKSDIIEEAIAKLFKEEMGKHV
jgi:hypothetical protein